MKLRTAVTQWLHVSHGVCHCKNRIPTATDNKRIKFSRVIWGLLVLASALREYRRNNPHDGMRWHQLHRQIGLPLTCASHYPFYGLGPLQRDALVQAARLPVVMYRSSLSKFQAKKVSAIVVRKGWYGAHQPITGLHFVDWQLICILGTPTSQGHAHLAVIGVKGHVHSKVRVRIRFRAEVRVSCHVTCVDSAKICCASKNLTSQQNWSDSAKNTLCQQKLAESANYLVMSQQKMLSKQKFEKFAEAALC